MTRAMTSAAALWLAAGCGSSSPTPACETAFAGNLVEDVDSTAACATLDATGTLAISVAAADGTTLMVSIELGAPSATTYSSETVMTWSALGQRTTADGGMCVYAAGSDAVPTGSFTLTMASVTAPHGDLQLEQYVQAMPGTDCGAGDNETVAITF